MQTKTYINSFKEDLTLLINKHGQESKSDTPDFILAFYIEQSLIAFERASNMRVGWNNMERRKSKNASKKPTT